MAGKDDLKLLASHIYTKLKPTGINPEEAAALSAVTMNQAILTGSLTEAIQAAADQDLVNTLQTGVPEKEQGKFNKVIQQAALTLRGTDDVTKGAVEYYPKKTKVNKAQLVKTYATKNFKFCRPKAPKGRVQKVSPITV